MTQSASPHIVDPVASSTHALFTPFGDVSCASDDLSLSGDFLPIDPAFLRQGDPAEPFGNGAFGDVVSHAGRPLALNEATTGYELSMELETLGERAATDTPIRLAALRDAARIEEEPVCVIRLPRRVPQGLHGNWIPKA